jgi:beta-glucosidase/6-phospho-beta-glucosidase/beta-galactosidase
LPQELQKMDGFENEQMTEFFSEYARLCFKNFGSRVKYWITFNEPYIFAMKGYDFANFAPGIKEPLEAPYKVVHTMLKCHALAYGIYQREFKDQQQGKIGLSIDSSNYSARNPEAKGDIEAADKCYQFRVSI